MPAMPGEEAEFRGFPFLGKVARQLGVPAENLVKVFHIEKSFHESILRTSDPAKRQTMYAELYSTVLPLLESVNDTQEKNAEPTSYRSLVMRFRGELTGNSVLDVGCGNGRFLMAVDAILPHGELLGMDTSAAYLPTTPRVRFVQCDITRFTLHRTFDVVWSNNVLEHIAPVDVFTHLQSVFQVLSPRGHFIVVMPNRRWGPSDITRIVDNTFTGRVPAQGSHLNESLYAEAVPLMKSVGFQSVKTILPLPLSMTVPLLGSVRIRPWLPGLIESSGLLRWITYKLKYEGKFWYKNPVILICRKGTQGESGSIPRGRGTERQRQGWK